MKTTYIPIAFLLVLVFYGFNTENKIKPDPVATVDMSKFIVIMNRTMSQIEAMKVTGDPDYDFASIFVIHHNGSIELLNEEIKKGSDPIAINLAKSIKEAKEKDLN